MSKKDPSGSENTDEHHVLKTLAVGAVLVGGAVGLGWMLWKRRKAKDLSPRQVLALRIKMVETALLRARSRQAPQEHIEGLVRYLEELRGYETVENDVVLDAYLQLDRLELKLRLEKGIPCDRSS